MQNSGSSHRLVIEPPGGGRLDKALSELAAAAALPLSRSRLRALIEAGRVNRIAGAARATVLDVSGKVKTGEVYEIIVPEAASAAPQAEDIPVPVVYEDDQLIVVDKPAGMVVHPAPGTQSGTLVNALLAICGDTLSGIGGVRRPGIVHRIDKDTSGLLVVAKTDAAHQALSAQFARHDLERSYIALVWGAPDRGDPRLAGLPGVSFEGGWGRIETGIDRHRTDRKKMAVSKTSGRRAATRFRTVERFGPPAGPVCALLECRLETGRTHQIRVHMTHIGHPLVGDQVYGRARTAPAGAIGAEARAALADFGRQALHAATLGFRHPGSGEMARFHSEPPQDFAGLIAVLRRDGAAQPLNGQDWR